MLIQIVEDDFALSNGIRLALSQPGTEFFQDREVQEAQNSFQKQVPDLIILDINLPDKTGYEYLTWVKNQSSTPVLILTALDMEIDEVTGLNLGADDYMTKPFSLAVLRARIENLLRRTGRRKTAVYEIDDLFLDFDRLLFRKGKTELSLGKNEQKLLRLFLENKGRVLTRELLTERIWADGGEYVDENALSVTMNRLRTKLEKGNSVKYIHTIYGQGYLWKREEENL